MLTIRFHTPEGHVQEAVLTLTDDERNKSADQQRLALAAKTFAALRDFGLFSDELPFAGPTFRVPEATSAGSAEGMAEGGATAEEWARERVEIFDRLDKLEDWRRLAGF